MPMNNMREWWPQVNSTSVRPNAAFHGSDAATSDSSSYYSGTSSAYSSTSSEYSAIPSASSATSSFNPRSFGQSSPASFDWYEYERRETPSSLGWNEDDALVVLYNFVVTKGKEPYLELQSSSRVTDMTPQRVYLDSPK
jgi:hypothetical protein